MTAFDQSSLTVRLSITIRVATKSDIPKLEWYGQFTHYRNLFRRAYRDQLEGRRVILVADCNNFPVGQLFIQLQSSNHLIADGRRRAYFYSFRVMEMFRGRGIGTALVSEAEGVVMRRDFASVTIAVVKANQAALRLYRQLGYQQFAEDSGRWSYIDHKGQTQYVHEPCWILEKSLRVR